MTYIIWPQFEGQNPHSAGLSGPESSLADSEEALRSQWGGSGTVDSLAAFSIWEVEREGWLSLGHSVELSGLTPNIYSRVLFFNKMILKNKLSFRQSVHQLKHLLLLLQKFHQLFRGKIFKYRTLLYLYHSNPHKYLGYVNTLKKRKNTIKISVNKWGNVINLHFSKEKIWMVNRYLLVQSLYFTTVQIEAQNGYHQEYKCLKRCNDADEMDPLFIAACTINLCHYRNQYRKLSKICHVTIIYIPVLICEVLSQQSTVILHMYVDNFTMYNCQEIYIWLITSSQTNR